MINFVVDPTKLPNQSFTRPEHDLQHTKMDQNTPRKLEFWENFRKLFYNMQKYKIRLDFD